MAWKFPAAILVVGTASMISVFLRIQQEPSSAVLGVGGAQLMTCLGLSEFVQLLLCLLSRDIATANDPMPNPSIKYLDRHGSFATPASKLTHRAVFHPLMSSCSGLSVIPSVLAILLAVPIGNDCDWRATADQSSGNFADSSVTSATAMMSQVFSSAFFHFLSLDD
jgi:hypothetical protein